MKTSIVFILGLAALVSQAQAATVNCVSNTASVRFSSDTKAAGVTLYEVSVYSNFSDFQDRITLLEDSLSADQTDREAAYLDVWRFHSQTSETPFSLDVPREALLDNAPAKFQVKLTLEGGVDTLNCSAAN